MAAYIYQAQGSVLQKSPTFESVGNSWKCIDTGHLVRMEGFVISTQQLQLLGCVPSPQLVLILCSSSPHSHNSEVIEVRLLCGQRRLQERKISLQTSYFLLHLRLQTVASHRLLLPLARTPSVSKAFVHLNTVCSTVASSMSLTLSAILCCAPLADKEILFKPLEQL